MNCPRCGGQDLDNDGFCDKCNWQEPFCTITEEDYGTILHAWSEWSDGKITLEQLNDAKKQIGVKYGFDATKVSINTKYEVRLLKLPS